MDNLLKRLGRRIRDLRSQRGLSQERFADLCGVHRTYMGHLERGEKNVSINSIVRVSEALEVTLAELFAGIDGERSAALRTPLTDLDRSKLLGELTILERSVESLKRIASPPSDQPASVTGPPKLKGR